MQTITITSMGKGGSTSSGNWHIHYSVVKNDNLGRPYTGHYQESFFTKKSYASSN